VSYRPDTHPPSILEMTPPSRAVAQQGRGGRKTGEPSQSRTTRQPDQYHTLLRGVIGTIQNRRYASSSTTSSSTSTACPSGYAIQSIQDS
jgi:hypothetical protein